MTDDQGLALYHIAPSRSSIVLWMLEEIGRPYALRVLRMSVGENRQPAFLAINPMGKAPALVHDGTVITETGAILCYLADAFPEAALGVPLGDRRRGTFLKWLFFMPGTMEPALMDRMLERPEAPRQMLGYGDMETLLGVVSAALQPGPYIFGEQFTAADVAIGSGLRWGRRMNLIPQRPEFDAYVARLEQRPALQRAVARDEAIAAEQAAAVS